LACGKKVLCYGHVHERQYRNALCDRTDVEAESNQQRVIAQQSLYQKRHKWLAREEDSLQAPMDLPALSLRKMARY